MDKNLISIIIPSRGRVKLLQNLLFSIIERTLDLSKVQIIILCDSDDIETVKFVSELKWLIPENFIYYVSQKIRIGTVKLYNLGASFSRGKYIWCLNDDVEISFEHWDCKLKYIENYLSDKPDRIAYIRVNDDWNENRCCFPIITREFYNIVGWVLPPSIIFQPADHALGYIFGYEGWPGGKTDTPILRELDLGHLIGIKHHSIYNKNIPDSTSIRAKQLYPWIPVETIKQELDLAIKKLLNEILKYR